MYNSITLGNSCKKYHSTIPCVALAEWGGGRGGRDICLINGSPAGIFS